MSLGTLGSTLNDELNRLANGGTYRDSGAMVDEALAAKQWANRENISPYSTDTVGVLNEIAGLGLDKKNWLDFNGVCNYIAGTSGLPAAAALRQIYPTTDLLTGVASYYVDAATPTNWGSLGYVYLPGVFNNYLSVPDSTALDITGDIDLRVQLALDDWTPTASQRVLVKGATGQQSYEITVSHSPAGFLNFRWSTDGTTLNTAASTAAVSFTDGATGWIRATRVSSTGVVKFFTSTDGTNWTQLGTDVSGTSGNIFSGTGAIRIGENWDGGNPTQGKLFRAQVLSGVGGTTVLDVNIATDYKSTNYDSFTATTGQTVSVVGLNTLANYGAAGSLLPTTVGSSTAADSNDPKFLAHDGTNYIYSPGVTGNTVSVPNSAALQITGDLDLRAYVALDDWTPATTMWLVYKIVAADGYALAINTSGTLSIYYNGSTIKTSTVATGAADGSALWIRATLDVNNGASGSDVKFYTSPNGTTWTQLGTTVTTAGIVTIATGTDVLSVTTNPFIGKMYRAQVYSDITETNKVLDVDTSVITAGSATSFTAVTGQTVTINRATSGRKTVAVTQPTWLFGTDDYMEVNNRYMAHSTAAENYVYLSGASGNYMTVSDTPPLSVTGDIDLRAQVALDDWSAVTNQSMLGKWSGGNRSYLLLVNFDGTLTLRWSADGSTLITKTSTVALSIADGAIKWVRATLDVDNGASGNDVKFFSSDDGTTWTQLGATVTTAGVTSIFDGGGNLEIGTADGGTSNLAKGEFFRAQVRNGIDGTIVLDADASVITLPSQTTFVDRSSNAYTVTINKSGVGTFVSTGNYLYLPGVNANWATAPDAAVLDITGDIDLRVKVALDDWTPSASQTFISKWDSAASNNRGFIFEVQSTGILNLQLSADGSAQSAANSTVATGLTDGSTKWVRATYRQSDRRVQFFTSDDGITWTQLGADVTSAQTSIYANISVLGIGGITNVTAAGGQTPRGKFFRAQVLNGIGGTVAFDANFESSITSLLQTSFTESSTNGATVTINRSGSTFRSAGVIDAGYLYPGATNTFSNSTTDFLNFGATDSFTVLVAVRQWNTPGAYRRYIAKQMAGINNAWGLMPDNVSFRVWSAIRDSGAEINGGVVAFTQGDLSTLSMVTNRTTETLTSYSGATSGTPTSTVGKGSLANPATMFIGTTPAGAPQDFEFVGAAVFRSVLTTAQIRQISNYFANREAYL